MGFISHLNNRRVPETSFFIASGVRSRSGRWGEASLPGRGGPGQSQGYILSRKMISIPDTVKKGSAWGLELSRSTLQLAGSIPVCRARRGRSAL